MQIAQDELSFMAATGEADGVLDGCDLSLRRRAACHRRENGLIDPDGQSIFVQIAPVNDIPHLTEHQSVV